MIDESRRIAAPQRVALAPWFPDWSTASQADPALQATITEGAWVTALAVAAVDGRAVVAVGVGSDLVLHDLATTEAIGLPLRGHTDVVRAIDVAMVDGRPIACSAGDDATAHLWDLRSAQPVALGSGAPYIAAPDRELAAVAITEIDGRGTVLTGGTDGVLRIWDLETGRARDCPGHDGHISGIALGVVAGEPIAATASRDSTVRIWRLRDGTTTVVLRGHRTWVNAVAVAESTGRVHVLSASNDDAIRVWDASTGEQLIVIDSPVSSIRTLAATSTDDGLAFAGAGVSGAVCWWNLGLPELSTRIMTGHTESVAAARIGRLANAPMVVTGAADETVRVWDPTAPSGRAVAAASGQRHDADVICLALAVVDGDQIVASGDENGTLCLWRLVDGSPVASITYEELGAPPPAEYGAGGPDIFALDFAEVNGISTLVIARADGSLTALDLTSRTIRFTIEAHVGPISAVATAVVNGRSCVFTAGDDAVIRCYDVRDGELVDELVGHTDWVNALVVLGEGMIASGSTDGTIRIWRMSDGTSLGAPLHTDEDTVNCLAVLDDVDSAHSGPLVAGSGDDGRLQIWDVPSGQLVRSIPASSEIVDAVTTISTSSGHVVVTGGVDGELRTWDPSDGALLATQPLPARVHALRTTGDSLVAAFGWEVTVLR
jgi:WD40 repeat protein